MADQSFAHTSHDTHGRPLSVWVSILTELVLSVRLTPQTVTLIALFRTLFQILLLTAVFESLKASHPLSPLEAFCTASFNTVCLSLQKGRIYFQLFWLTVAPLLMLLCSLVLSVYLLLTRCLHRNGDAVLTWKLLVRPYFRKVSAWILTFCLCGGNHLVLASLFILYFLQPWPPVLGTPGALFCLGFAAHFILLGIGTTFQFHIEGFGINWRTASLAPVARVTPHNHLHLELKTIFLIVFMGLGLASTHSFVFLFTAITLLQIKVIHQLLETPFQFAPFQRAAFLVLETLELFLLILLSSNAFFPSLSLHQSIASLFGGMVLCLPLSMRVLKSIDDVRLDRRVLTDFSRLFELTSASELLWVFDFLVHLTHPRFHTKTFLGKSSFEVSDLILRSVLMSHLQECQNAFCMCRDLCGSSSAAHSNHLQELFQLFREYLYSQIRFSSHQALDPDDFTLMVRILGSEHDSLKNIVRFQQFSWFGSNDRQRVVKTTVMSFKRLQVRQPSSNEPGDHSSRHLDVPRILRRERQSKIVLDLIKDYLTEFAELRQVALQPVIQLRIIKYLLERLRRLSKELQAVVEGMKDNAMVATMASHFFSFFRVPFAFERSESLGKNWRSNNTLNLNEGLRSQSVNRPSEFLLGRLEITGDILLVQTSPSIENELGWRRHHLLNKNVCFLMPPPVAQAHRETIRNFFEKGTVPNDHSKKEVFLINGNGDLVDAIINHKVVVSVTSSCLLVFAEIRTQKAQDFFVSDGLGNVLQVTPLLAAFTGWPVTPEGFQLPFYLFFDRIKADIPHILSFSPHGSSGGYVFTHQRRLLPLLRLS